MKQLRILIYDTNYMKGASRVIAFLKIKQWQKKGCRVTIICVKEGEEYYRSKLKNIDFILIDYTYKVSGALSLPWEFTKITVLTLINLKQMINKFDIVYSQSGIIDFLFTPWILTFFDKKIKWFVVVENTVPPPHKRPGPFLRKLIPYIAFLLGDQLLRKANGIFVLTPVLYNYYKSRGYKAIRTGEYYGIDTEIFKGLISKTTPYFDAVYTGRIHEAKGVFDLIEVVKEVVKTKKSFTLGIMGEGDESIKKRLQENIISYGLKNNIVFLGYVTGKRKGDILRKAGFFLFLSYDEAGSHAILEAIANNKFVIAYNLPVYKSVYKKNIANGQMAFFKLKEFKKIADFIISLGYKELTFSNKLEDYRWGPIVKNELQYMIKAQENKTII